MRNILVKKELELLDINTELKRVKEFANSNGYDNSTSINNIVRQYRKSLKDYRDIVMDDISDLRNDK